jgi:DNA-binding transcriptional MerR regulator
MSEQLRIGEVAELTGTTPRTIRYYEEIGLLPEGRSRRPGSHRVYDREDVERLRTVLDLKRTLGLSLDELRGLYAAETARAARREEWDRGVEDPVRRRAILEEALEHIGNQLELIRRRREELDELEEELTTRRRRVRDRLRATDRTEPV